MKVLFYSIVVLMVASCSPTLQYYTKNLQDEARWSSEELSKIQFYISNDIVLWRDISKGESVITNGKIKMVDGKEVEEVIIRQKTPGVFLFSPQKNHYAISFDPVDDRNYLVFGPSDKVNGRYVLLAKEWNKNYGKVTYGDKVYRTASQSAYANLLVDIAKTKRTKVSSTRPTGRRVE